jgi:hypothetical protein
VAGTVEPDASARPSAQPARALDTRALREIDEAAAAIPDAGVAAAARRLMTKAWPGLTVLALATVLASCASAHDPTITNDDQLPRRVAVADPRGDAYYAYSVAQMNIQAGRFETPSRI